MKISEFQVGGYTQDDVSFSFATSNDCNEPFVFTKACSQCCPKKSQQVPGDKTKENGLGIAPQKITKTAKISKLNYHGSREP